MPSDFPAPSPRRAAAQSARRAARLARLAALGIEESLDTAEAALALAVSQKTIISWIETGTLQGGKTGDRWWVLASDVRRRQQAARDGAWASNDAAATGSAASGSTARNTLSRLENALRRKRAPISRS